MQILIKGLIEALLLPGVYYRFQMDMTVAARTEVNREIS